MNRDETVTTRLLLRRMAEGDGAAEEELYRRVYSDLHRLTRAVTGGRQIDPTLEATALIGDAWLRLAGHDGPINDRRHFLRVAARAMRWTLVDQARARAATNRVADAQPLSESGLGPSGSDAAVTVLSINDAIEQLEDLDSHLARVAELRIFGGLTHAEIAEAMQVSVRTIERSWRSARAHLRRDLELGEEA